MNRVAEPVGVPAECRRFGAPTPMQHRHIGRGIFAWPGLQHRGFRHRRAFVAGQIPAEGLLVFVDCRAGFGRDLRGPFAPRGHQLGRDTDDFGLPVRVRRLENDPEPGMQFGAQRGLVDRAGGLLVVVDLVPIDRAPHPVGAAQLVRHQRVGVQLRIPGTRRPVVEQRRHQPRRRDLFDAVGAAPRHRRVRIEVAQRGRHRSPMGVDKLLPSGCSTQRPQGADALRCGEREVETGDRVRPPRAPQRRTGDRVQRPREHRLKLYLADNSTRLQTQFGKAATEPTTRRFTVTEVVLARARGDTVLVIPPRRAADLRRRQH